jgi:hypothetical protein
MACGTYAGRALFLVRNSQSSRVKMSLVTAAIEKRARSCVQSASMRAVFPEPTGLATSVCCPMATYPDFLLLERMIRMPEYAHHGLALTYPPIPIVKALSSQSLFSMIGISRPRKLPGPSRISCVWPWSAAACECDAPSWA